MKQLLLIIALFCASYMTVNAQTKTWVGGSGSSFNVAENWSPVGIPDSNDNVIIPTGSNVIMDGANIKSFAIQGNSEVTMTNTVFFTNTSSIAANASFTWSTGYLQGEGTLNNNGNFTVINNINKYFGPSKILNNAGTINFPVGFYLFVGDDSTINNLAAGVIDFQSDANIGFGNSNNMLNNAGQLKKSSGTNSTIEMKMVNTGTIAVESGTLTLGTQEKTFDGGVYNVVTGSLLIMSAGNINLSGTLTGQLDGDLKCGSYGNNVTVANTATLNFTGNGFNWSDGHLVGDGVLTNNGLFNFSTTANRYIDGATTLDNQGIIKFTASCYLFINGDSVLNNTDSGIIDFQADGYIEGGGSGNHILNNVGLIKKTNGSASGIDSKMLNTGTISVESGTITLGGEEKMLNGGIYNINAGSLLYASAGNISLSGFLTGQVEGEMKCGSYGNNVTVTNAASLDFTGNGLHWSDGHLLGNGILTNNGIFNFSSSANRYIEGSTTLANQGTINFIVGCTVFVSNNSVIDNKESGVINFQAEASIGTSENGSIINEGLFEKTGGTGVSYLNLSTNNSGIINVMSGEFEFMNGSDFINMEGGKVMGTATIDVPASANFINNGIFAPGNSPGTLTVIGDFNSSPTSELEIELNGNTQGVDYDLLVIQGNGNMDGTVNVTMGIAAELNDEFIIATTTGTISQCDLATSTSADFDGMTYTFDVFCRNNNEVVLKVANINLGVNDLELSESSIQLFPNPVRNMLTIKNRNNLELENAQIMDITGKIISTCDLKNMGLTKDISMDNFSNGLYFVKINGMNNSVTKRVVKQ